MKESMLCCKTMAVYLCSRSLWSFSCSFCCKRSAYSTTSVVHDIDRKNIDSRVVKIAIIGPPNAGKSTLINNLVGRRVCATSSKVHTTRSHLRAVGVEGNTQMIFLDTPGLVTAEEMHRHKLDRKFMCDVELALPQADVIGVVHDVANQWTRNRIDLKSLRLLQLYLNKTSVLILNKIDVLKTKRKLFDIVKVLTNNNLISSREVKQIENTNQLSELSIKQHLKQQHGWSNFSEVFMVSALTGSGVGDIKEYFLQQAQCTPWIFKDSQFTDASMEEIMLQAVQAKLLEHLPQEIPYNLSVGMEYLEKTPAGTITAVILVKCPSPRLEKLVVGSKGGRIKFIAQEAEQDLQNTFLETVRLKLVVTARL